MIWEQHGSAHQVSIVEAALSRCDFPWDVLNVFSIPVEWADLSVYERATAVATEEHDHGGTLIHDHGGEWDPMVREVDGRMRILGLAWYSGKISLDLSLEDNLELAKEVFLSEAAHMVDFFWMDDVTRVVVWNEAHHGIMNAQLPLDADVQDGQILDLDHPEHGWFDIGGYYGWVGEWWMGAFVLGFSTNIPVTIEFDHPLTYERALAVRHSVRLLLEEQGVLIASEPGGVTPEPGPIPPLDENKGCWPRWLARALARRER